MNLKLYPITLELVRVAAPSIAPLRRRSYALADQLERALISIPLNVAEVAYSRGRNRHKRLRSHLAAAPMRRCVRIDGRVCESRTQPHR